MAIELTIVLRGTGRDLDRTQLLFLEPPAPTPARVQKRIRDVIANWELRPGDTIEILGNEEAFDKL